VCGTPLTIGVAHRVSELADRPAGYRPPGAPGFTSLIQLRQVISEICATGPASKKVTAEVSRLVAALGPELGILSDVPLAEVGRAGGSPLAEAVGRLRRGAVTRQAGYDGAYGSVALFAPGELDNGDVLFDLAPVPAARAALAAPAPATVPAGHPGPAARPSRRRVAGPDPGAARQRRDHPRPAAAGPDPAGDAAGRLLGQLDAGQRAAVQAPSPLMIVAGPGTGKTRTLTHRIAWQLATAGLPAAGVLAVTFTPARGGGDAVPAGPR